MVIKKVKTTMYLYYLGIRLKYSYLTILPHAEVYIFMMSSLERKDINILLVTNLVNISPSCSFDLIYEVHTSSQITTSLMK